LAPKNYDQKKDTPPFAKGRKKGRNSEIVLKNLHELRP